MPVLPMSFTHKFKSDWADYWSRQTEPMPPMAEVLREAQVVTDYTGYTERPLDGAEFWTHPALPADIVVVRREEGRAVVIALRRKVVCHSPLVKHVGKRTDEPMPEVGDEPTGGTARERRSWVIQQQRTLEKWANRQPDHPDRQQAVERIARLQARSKELYAEVQAGYLADLSATADPQEAAGIAASVGANDLTCWLVGEVVRLTAELRAVREELALKADCGAALAFRNATSPQTAPARS